MLKRRRLIAASVSVLAAAVLVTVSACTGTPSPSESPTASSNADSTTDPSVTPDTPFATNPPTTGNATSAPTPHGVIQEPVRVAVVGDSNSTGHKGTLDAGIAADWAYIAQIEGPEITFAGGWARDGATSRAMAQNVGPVDNADVLVIMAGTNNTAQAITADGLQADLESIVATVDAKYVVLAAIPPLNARPNYPVQLNAGLEQLAQHEGWFYHDSWGQLRGTDNKWLDQYMVEGIHTTQAGYGVFGADMEAYIVKTFVGK